MNPKIQAVLNWSKKNWIVVACVALPVLAVPALVFGATTWNAKVVKQAQERIEGEVKEIRNPNLSYKLPGIRPEDPAVEWTGAPNKVAIKAFKEARARQMGEANDIVARLVAFNRGDRKPLVDGLFPEPPPGNQTLQREMARRFNQEAQRELLKSINAQGPVSQAEVASRLNDRRNEFLERLRASLGAGQGGGGGEVPLTVEQAAELQADLLGVRMDAYRSHGARLLTYGDVSVFVLPTFGNETSVPTLAECWDWQVQFWVQQDLISAIGLANVDAKNLGVAASAVKRIERIAVLPPGATAGDAGGGGGGAGEGPDWASSFTGRRSSADLDVRNAELTVVLASADVPKFIDALAKTNLMTVTGMKLSNVDIAADLALGYYYGPDSVIRATLTIETIWLREWTGALMPKQADSGGSGDPGMPSPGGSGGPMRGGS